MTKYVVLCTCKCCMHTEALVEGDAADMLDEYSRFVADEDESRFYQLMPSSLAKKIWPEKFGDDGLCDCWHVVDF